MILITGGAGFIGSHAVVEFLTKGYNVLILDNLSNSSRVSIERVKTITQKNPMFIEGDINDRMLLDKIFTQHAIDAVIHFAGLKAVSESVDKPIEYYQNNVSGTLVLCKRQRLKPSYLVLLLRYTESLNRCSFLRLSLSGNPRALMDNLS